VTAYLTIPEAASLLKCHPSTVKRMLSDGQLTRLKVRRGTRIDPQELEAVLRQEEPQKPRDNVVELRSKPRRGSFREQVRERRGVG
jgi:excisionase family DNA binding protein